MSTLQSIRSRLADALRQSNVAATLRNALPLAEQDLDAQAEAAKRATFCRVSAFAARLNKHSLESSGQDHEAARWAEDVLTSVLQVVDLRAEALLSAQNLALFSRARAVLGIAASQRLLSDSPEVLALIAWRFGLTSDVQALLANTHVYGLLEAIREFEPVAARSWVCAHDHYYRVYVSHLSGWDSVRNMLLAVQQANPQFDVKNLSPTLDAGSRLIRRPLGPLPHENTNEAAEPTRHICGRVRIPDDMREAFLARLPHTALICVDFSSVD